MTITLKPRNDVGHVDALTYLATALEDDSPRKIPIDTHEEPSNILDKNDISIIFLLAQMFFLEQYKQSSIVQQGTIRIRRMELDEAKSNITPIEVPPFLNCMIFYHLFHKSSLGIPSH